MVGELLFLGKHLLFCKPTSVNDLVKLGSGLLVKFAKFFDFFTSCLQCSGFDKLRCATGLADRCATPHLELHFLNLFPELLSLVISLVSTLLFSVESVLQVGQ